MLKTARLITLIAALGSCLALTLWIGADAPNSPRTSAVQPHHSAQPAQEAAKKETRQNPLRAFWQWITKDAATFFTAGIFLLTFVLAGSTAGLWLETGNIRHGQQEDTRILQRAHLWVDMGSINARTDEPGFVPRIVIRNAGRMPAKHVAWVFGEPHLTTENEWKPTGHLPEPGGDITLAPGAEMTHGAKTLYLQKEQFLGPTPYLYIWGAVRYHDGFESGRVSQFCHRYNMKLLWWHEERTGRRALAKQHGRYNRHHNDAT